MINNYRSNIVLLVLFSLLSILFIVEFISPITGAHSLQINDYEEGAMEHSTSEQLVSITKDFDFKETAASFLKGINCPKKVRYNGLSWECGNSEIYMDINVTDNSGMVVMSDEINLGQASAGNHGQKAKLSDIGPHQFRGVYILLLNSSPIYMINGQDSLESLKLISNNSEFTETILSTPKIKDVLTLTTFENDLTLEVDKEGWFNPTNISKLYSWDYAQADWDKIVNSSFKYIYYDQGGLICNQNYLKLQENPAVRLLCNEFVVSK